MTVAAVHIIPGGGMKPVAIVVETPEVRAERLRRKRETDGLLEQIEGREQARFQNVMQMLSWFFALYEHMESIPAIDPSRDLIQGVRVDRDERISWLGKVKKALEALRMRQGNDQGVFLLWAHFRVGSFRGYRERGGVKMPVFTRAGVAIWELYREPGVNLSQRKAKDAFWWALGLLEDFALEHGWVEGRMPRKPKTERAYRRVNHEG